MSSRIGRGLRLGAVMTDREALVAALSLAIVASTGERQARAAELGEKIAGMLTPFEVERAARLALKATEGMGR